MKVDIDKQDKGTVKIRVELEIDELRPYIQTAASRLGKQIKTPGFRPGKAPYDMIKREVGEAVIYQEAADDIVKKTYPDIVIKHRLEAIGRPQINLEKVAPGNPFIYSATVSLLPNVVLGDYKNLKAKRKDVKADSKEVKKTLTHLRKMRAQEKLVNRVAQNGDKVELDVRLFIDNVPVDEGMSKNHPIIIGENQYVPGFEEKIVGLSKGQEKEFQLPYPKDYFQKNLAGRNVDIKVKVNSVYQIDIPELSDEFAKSLGKFNNIAELEKQIAENVQKEAESKEQQRFEIAMLNELTEKSEFDEIPDVLLEAELQRMVQELKVGVERQGLKFEDYLLQLKKTEEEIRKEFHEQGIKRIKGALILRAIRLKENITVDAKKVDEDIAKQKEQYKDELETYNKIDSPGYREQYEDMLINRKVFEYLNDLIDQKK